jgi:TatD DNase family protein
VLLLDAHCHIDRFPNPASIVAACEKECVTTVAVTNLPSHYKMGSPHVRGYRYVRLALGLHPLVVGKEYHELDEFLRILPQVVFVGEIGLDFSAEGLPTKSKQLSAFRAIAQALTGTRKFVTLHSRGAGEAVLDVLGQFSVKHAVFHWYSDTLTVLDQAIQQGFHFSVNPAMIRSEKGRGIIAHIPPERVLTETDGPYLQIGKRPAEPRDVRGVVEFLAKEWGITIELAAKQVLDNFQRIVGESQAM